MNEVFISYSRTDVEFVRRLDAALERVGSTEPDDSGLTAKIEQLLARWES